MAAQYTAGLSVGQVLTAATMNSIGAAWNTYVPAVTQGATLTKTTNVSNWGRINKVVFWHAVFQFTSAGTAANILSTTLPAAAVAGNTFGVNGSALFYDTSANTTYLLTAGTTNTTNLSFWYNGTANFFGNQPAITVANGDWLSFTISYETST